jgi:hypothetical protein
MVVAAPSAAPRSRTAAEFRRLAEMAVLQGRYADAAANYRAEAAVYDRLGDANAATVERLKADRWDTRIGIYVESAQDRKELKKSFTAAKYEPAYGCYFSAFVGNDALLGDGGSQWHGEGALFASRAAQLGKLLAKPLACSWVYCRYGQPFPLAWAKSLKKYGIVPQVAWEPDYGLESVQDNDYLHRFARDIADVGGPVFIRFAGEMNGTWTSYHDDPKLYRTKFRLLHDIFEVEAPNAAMIWCVNSLPDNNYDLYYPGDDVVDWVGINVYTVVHHDNDPQRPAALEHPTALIRKLYDRYSARKPIAVCEFGASHQEKLNSSKDYSDVAAAKIATFFTALPRQFPRIKMVGIFDSNNLISPDVMPSRRLNNYCVTDSQLVLKTLQRSLASDYFLPRVVTTAIDAPSKAIRPLGPTSVLVPPVTITSSVESYELFPTVVTLLDGVTIGRATQPGDHGVSLTPSGLSPGRHQVEVQVYDSQKRLAGKSQVDFTVVTPNSESASKE